MSDPFVPASDQALSEALRLARRGWFQATFTEAATIEAAILELQARRRRTVVHLDLLPGRERVIDQVKVTIPPPAQPPPVPGGDIFCKGGRE